MDNLALVESIFFAALEKNAPGELAAFLDKACASDVELRSHVERLLKAQPKLGSFLQEPAARLASPVDSRPFTERPGATVGHYTLIKQIGEGGMGLVFVAEQQQPLRRQVALKVIKPGMDTRNVIARFEAERQALALMDHPNIARVLDAGATESGRPFFVMELVQGVPITDYCDRHELEPAARLALFVSVCEAVQHAHSKGVVHRDLKPSNLLVASLDGTPVVKVIDLGVAKAIACHLTDKTIHTHLTQIIGTPAYMSPEQADIGNPDIDTRSDVYSLGVLLYELLTGTTPFERERLGQVAFDEIRKIIREEEPPRPSARLIIGGKTQPAVSTKRKTELGRRAALCKGDLDWIVMKALEKNRTRRYDTPSALAADVRRFLAEEPVEARPPSAGYRFRKFARRNKVALAVASLISFFVILLGSGAGWALRDRAFRDEEARQERHLRDAETLRERTAREAETTRAVNSALAEAEALQRARKVPEALAKIRQAASILAAGTSTPELKQRVGTRLADMQFVADLENIRGELAADLILVDPTFSYDYARADQRYAQAFRGFGINVEALTPQEAAGRLLQRTVPLELATALDHWATALRKIKPPNDARWKHLLAVAQITDTDPLRRQLWTALEIGNGDGLNELLLRIKGEDLPAETLLTLAEAIGGRADAENLLRQGQRAHPNDFWINYQLANRLFNNNPPNNEDAVRFFTAALAIRPDNAAAHTMLGIALSRTGKVDEATAIRRVDEAIAVQRKAIALNADFPAFYVNLSNALAQKGLLDDAEKALQKAISLRPDFVLALKALSRLEKDRLYEAGLKQPQAGGPAGKETATETPAWQGEETDLAIVALRKAIQANPTNPDLHYKLGKELAAKDRTSAAITALQKAVELRRQHIDWYLELAGLLKKSGRWEDTIVTYRAALANEQQAQYAAAIARVHGELAWMLANAPDPLVREPREALEVATKAVALKPKDSNFWNALGIAHYRLRNYQDALDNLQKAIVLNPNGLEDPNAKAKSKSTGQAGNSISFFAIAMAHWKLGSKTEALQWYGKGIQWMERNFPSNDVFVQLHVEATEVLGIADPKQRQLGPALAALNRGAELANKSQYDKAIVELRESLRLRPEVASSLAILADSLNFSSRTDEAIVEYRNLLRLIPNHPWAHAHLGNMLRRKGELADAIVECRVAINLAMNDVAARGHAHSQLGRALRVNGQLEEAIKECREAVRLQPTGAWYHNELALALEDKGLLDQAIAEHREAKRLDPAAFYIHNALAKALVKNGQLKQASVEFKRMTEDHPREPACHVNLGRTYEKLGQRDKCVAAFQDALRVAPATENEGTIAWVLANSPDPKQRDAKRAKNNAKKALDKDITAGENWTALGVACYRCGEWKDGLAALTQAVKLRYGGDGISYFFLAMTHRQLHDKDQARTWFDKGVAWMAQHQPKDAELQRIRIEAAELLEMNAAGLKDAEQP